MFTRFKKWLKRNIPLKKRMIEVFFISENKRILNYKDGIIKPNIINFTAKYNKG
jgi:hypothetical protein